MSKSDKFKFVIGLNSGTSVDSVDIVLVKIKGFDVSTEIKVLKYQEYKYPECIRNLIFECFSNASSNVEKICSLNFILGRFYAQKILEFIKTSPVKSIDLIGSHGQTVYHIPTHKKVCNISSKSTLQLGDPSVICALTGIDTVGEFRYADVAVGGDGAPLVPYLDYILFRSKTKSRLLINIGGIANITFLEKNCDRNNIIAFDTGPGNVLIDLSMKILFNKDFDKDGCTAYKGKYDKEIFEILRKNDKFVTRKPPKSTGREYYNYIFLEKILNERKFLPADIINTLTYYTYYTIRYNIENFINSNIDEVYITGGGSNNICLIELLKEFFGKNKVKKFDFYGINEKNKEAVLFAVLANEAINRNSANIPSVTGSKNNVILGKICYAR
ncbi:MAG: anhydro-N-acetylmuramic acid kinase [Ignavibacteria bacterium]|nr:anhydro-N-acetylmuramic acid kinase [Ignavibacteria bacterium]